jgi:hypothetical protein
MELRRTDLLDGELRHLMSSSVGSGGDPRIRRSPGPGPSGALQ